MARDTGSTSRAQAGLAVTVADDLTAPRPLDEVDGHRHSTWLELFFDLVFVAALAQLSLDVVNDPTAGGFLEFVALFVPVWWAWVGFTFYASRFEREDAVDRILWLTAMLAVAALAVSIDDPFHAHAVAFALSHASVRTVLVALYVLARLRDAAARELSAFLLVGFALGSSLWWASAFVPEPTTIPGMI